MLKVSVDATNRGKKLEKIENISGFNDATPFRGLLSGILKAQNGYLFFIRQIPKTGT
ncbi:hypothetical protein ACFL4K_02625 [Candidatus Neomarinimicrobiota bacterium]